MGTLAPQSTVLHDNVNKAVVILKEWTQQMEDLTHKQIQTAQPHDSDRFIVVDPSAE